MYERLVPIKCAYNEQTRTYVGKGKVIGRIAGQIIAMTYALLMTDYEATSHLASGAKLPEPMLYDAEVHKHHRAGNYVPRSLGRVHSGSSRVPVRNSCTHSSSEIGAVTSTGASSSSIVARS